MSATSHDAFPQPAGIPVRIVEHASGIQDPTEDIADEVTSELASVAARDVTPQASDEHEADGSAAEASAALAAGHVLRDRYVLGDLIGGGGTAVVFRAVDLRRDATATGGRHVALKLLRPEHRGEPRGIARLQREFRQTQSITHPNIVRFFDLDCDRGSWFIVMELLTGETLAARLRRAAPAGLPAADALAIAVAVAEALAHAHRRDVVHGDVKPANIFLTDTGDVRLIDFGVAPGPGDAPEPAAGTRAYASPGVLAGESAEAADDVFSLACVTCELLTGARPYRRRGDAATAGAGLVPEHPAGLDDAIWKLLLRGLDPRRQSRPGMEELARALRGEARPAEVEAAPVLAAPAAAVPAPGMPPPVASTRRTRRVAGGVMGAGLMLLLGILIGGFESDPRPEASPVARIDPAGASAIEASPPMHQIVQGKPAGGTGAERQPVPAAAQAAPVAVTGSVTFGQPSMIVSSRAIVAPIPLRHLGSERRDVRADWRIIAGSAQPGRDYGGPESGTESFVAGNTFRILYVPIIANRDSTADRTFVVELTGVTPGVEVGRAPRIAVTILGDR